MCALNFNQVPNDVEADIVISCIPGEHGDGLPFDGRGGEDSVHAYFTSFGGDIHFNDDEIRGRTFPG